jgi:hypothetical protein
MAYKGVKYKLVESGNYSGCRTTIYFIVMEGERVSQYEKFVAENRKDFPEEIDEIENILLIMGDDTGARYDYFEHKKGKRGDGVCYLHDEEKKLRLYCIWNGTGLIVVGGGAHKPTTVKASQDDPKLDYENTIACDVSHHLLLKIIEKEIQVSPDGQKFIGNLDFIEHD